MSFVKRLAVSHGRLDASRFAFAGALLALALTVSPAKAADAPSVDLTGATLVLAPGMTGPEKKAAEMLVDETGKRSQIYWTSTAQAPGSGAAVYLGQKAALVQAYPALAAKLGSSDNDGKAEGYHIVTSPGLVIVAGNDARGVLFGAGRLLRLMEYTGEKAPDHLGTVMVADGLNLATAPAYALRGHQLGYRPKTNAYDGWDPKMMEQYVRDMVIFGANAIEGIPARSDDQPDSPHYALPPTQGLVEQSRIAQEYGIEFWVWYPAMDPDYGDSATVEANLKEWEAVLKQLPKLDAIFVPGGDPGHTEPKKMFPFMEKVEEMAKRSHPNVKLWMSPQGFDQAWMNDFYDIMKSEPTWLEGIVFGPQQRESLEELSAHVPKRYKIRFYPDITHSHDAQYPVPDWDYAFQATENREGPNPRPLDEAAIFHRLQPLAPAGFLTYSEGCNDDVNKFVWSGLGWDPNEPVIDILRDFSHYFIGASQAEGFAQGLMALERNWRGPLISNEGVYTTLAQFQDLEKTASPQVLENWRFQQALYRAYYDATDRARLIAETRQEARAIEQLQRAPVIGSLAAISAAEKALEPSEVMPAATWRARVSELAEAMFNSIHAQLSVSRYKAEAIGRGGDLDLIDAPLNDAQWLNAQFTAVKALATEPERLNKLDQVVNWTNPGPGGFYDNLGDVNPLDRSHVVPGLSYAEDPAFLKTPFIGIGGGPRAETQMAQAPRGRVGAAAPGAPGVRAGAAVAANPARAAALAQFAQALAAVRRISSSRYGETLHEQPLEMQYNNLSKTAHYKLKVIYGAGSRALIRLVANGKFEIQPLEQKSFQVEPLVFDIPPAATAGGDLRLTWTGAPGIGGDGRGVQVSEVWLVIAP